MLGSMDIIAFVPTRNPNNARAYYEKTLGLRFVNDDEFALVFDANGVMLRVVNVSGVKGFTTAPFTILGWSVGDIAKAVKTLHDKGVTFERYPGMGQDEKGVWNSPSGAKVAWFKDPDGNVLSITEH
jgi:catechol 2,3-dioxygenase-like lactoylglutathione lyase family enzyme